jgi:NIPSNAP protein
MNYFIEIRTLTLKPNTRDQFHYLYIEEALPRLQRWKFDVVAHGPSVHDENTYYVIRRYASLAQRDQMEDAYYASDDWRKGPREAMLALIEYYNDIVLELDEATINGLRGGKNHFVEIRSYDLKPGTRAEYHRLFLEEAMPLLKRWNVDVVRYGPSLHDENSYYLMRRFDNLTDREQSEELFMAVTNGVKVRARQCWLALKSTLRLYWRWMRSQCRACEEITTELNVEFFQTSAGLSVCIRDTPHQSVTPGYAPPVAWHKN